MEQESRSVGVGRESAENPSQNDRGKRKSLYRQIGNVGGKYSKNRYLARALHFLFGVALLANGENDILGVSRHGALQSRRK